MRRAAGRRQSGAPGRACGEGAPAWRKRPGRGRIAPPTGHGRSERISTAVHLLAGPTPREILPGGEACQVAMFRPASSLTTLWAGEKLALRRLGLLRKELSDERPPA